VASFDCADGHVGQGPVSVVIWTTTPWTLPANRAVALHAELDYALVQVEGEHPERLILAADLVKDVMDRAGIAHYHNLGYCQGRRARAAALPTPSTSYDVPVVLGDHVTTDPAPAPSTPPPATVRKTSRSARNTAWKWPTRWAATALPARYRTVRRPARVQGQRRRGRGADRARRPAAPQAFNHSYPHCWRHKTPIIFRATPQWFISMEQAGLRSQALQRDPQGAAGCPTGARIASGHGGKPPRLVYLPSAHLGRAHCPVRAQGHPGPAPAPPPDGAGRQAGRAGRHPGLVGSGPAELLGEEAEQYDKVLDTLDVWFDSGSTHASVVDVRPEFQGHPADLYLEGSDQHRGWFMSSLMISAPP
jgi:isoleucyl-tRNA synthetase